MKPEQGKQGNRGESVHRQATSSPTLDFGEKMGDGVARGPILTPTSAVRVQWLEISDYHMWRTVTVSSTYTFPDLSPLNF